MKPFYQKFSLTAFSIAIITFSSCSSNSCQKGSEQSAGMAAHQKLNVLYAGIGNPIKAAVFSNCTDEMQVKLTTGTIEKNEDGTYQASISKDVDETTLEFYRKGESDPFANQVFKVQPLPKPDALIAGKKSGSIQKDTLTKTNKITAELPNHFLLKDEISYEVASYRWTFIPGEGDEGDIITKTKNGSKFSGLLIDSVAKAKDGDRLIVDQIEVTGPDGKKPLNTGISLKIKDWE